MIKIILKAKKQKPEKHTFPYVSRKASKFLTASFSVFSAFSAVSSASAFAVYPVQAEELSEASKTSEKTSETQNNDDSETQNETQDNSETQEIILDIPTQPSVSKIGINNFINYEISVFPKSEENGGKTETWQSYSAVVQPNKEYVLKIRKKDKTPFLPEEAEEIKKDVIISGTLKKAPEMPYSSIKIKNIAHRGFSTLAPQNTLPAFELAGKSKKVYGIETDVHATKDGKLIVLHDDTLNTTTDITPADENYGKPVEKMDYEEVEKYNVETKTSTGSLKAGIIYKNLHIPTAEDYIKICKKYNKIAIIELKGFNDPKYYQQLTDLIFRENMQKKTVFISGKLGQLENMKETVSKASTIPMMPIFYENTDTNTDDYINLNGFTGIDINIKKTTTNTLKTLRSQKVGIWTVKLSDIKKAAELVKSGAEYITADSEDVMSKVYDSVYPSKSTKEIKETKNTKNTKNTKAAKNTKTSKKAKSSKVISSKTKKKTDTKSKKKTKNTKKTKKGKSPKQTVKKASTKKKTKKNEKKASKKPAKKGTSKKTSNNWKTAVLKKNISVKKSASSSSKTAFSVKKGKKIKTLKTSSKWKKINYNGKYGYTII